MRSAGHRHLRADDVHRSAGAAAVCRVFGDPQQAGGPTGDDLVGEDGRIVGAGHAAVQMDLGVARLDVRGDEHVGLGHCRTGGFALPSVRAEVVTAEDDAVSREPGLVGEAEHEIPELRRTQTGVAAELVDLVRRRLDQDVAAVGGGLCNGRLHHGGMGRTDGVDPDGFTGFVPADRVGQPVDRWQCLRGGDRCHAVTCRPDMCNICRS